MKTWKLSVMMIGLAGIAFGAAYARSEPEAAAKPNGAGSTITLDLGDGITLDAVLIPAGKFLMGLPGADTKDKGPENNMAQHEVTITKPFYLGKYEVTQEQYEKVMGNNPSVNKNPKHPVEGKLKWGDAQDFCAKVSKSTGKIVRLPTEAEWEYASLGGSATPPKSEPAFLNEVAWWSGNAEGKTHPVGQKKPNAYGLYDMYGNVYEWCQDWLDFYPTAAVVDPRGPEEGPIAKAGHFKGGACRVMRGGCWHPGVKTSYSTLRSAHGPNSPAGFIGFRVVVVTAKAQ